MVKLFRELAMVLDSVPNYGNKLTTSSESSKGLSHVEIENRERPPCCKRIRSYPGLDLLPGPVYSDCTVLPWCLDWQLDGAGALSSELPWSSAFSLVFRVVTPFPARIHVQA